MELEQVQHHGADELFANLRNVGMLTNPDVKLYKECSIELRSFHTDDLAPAQRYVLTTELMKVRDLQWALKEHEIDLFALNGYVSIWLKGFDDPIDVLPPVVEESEEADGSVVSIVNDGMHRVYLARMERTPVQVVFVRNVPREYPYYAFPLVNGWNDVEIVQDLPPGYVKKWHRIKNYKTLYRDFNTGFRNVGGPRGHFTNAGK